MKPADKRVCEYYDCGKPVFCTENVTGTQMKLCQDHFMELFGNIARQAKIVEEENNDKSN